MGRPYSIKQNLDISEVRRSVVVCLSVSNLQNSEMYTEYSVALSSTPGSYLPSVQTVTVSRLVKCKEKCSSFFILLI